MYNLVMHATQTVGSTLVIVSLSETDDAGNTLPLAGWHVREDATVEDLEPYSLEEFLEHVKRAVVKSMSSNA